MRPLPTKQVAVAVTETKIVGADELRTVLTIQNIDAIESVDISDQNPDEGLRILAGQSMDLHTKFGDKVKHRWNGMASGAMNVRVLEGFEGTRAAEPSQRPIRRGETLQGSARPGAPKAPPGGGGGGVHPK